MSSTSLTYNRSWITAWCARHQDKIFLALIFAGILQRIFLILRSPHPYGYVYDFYHEGIQWMDRTGRLPTAAVCWQGYHPPLYYTLGLVFYKIGKPLGNPLLSLTLLSMICGLVTIWYSILILRLYRQRGLYFLLGAAFVWMFPCLFISSFGAEADILLTAIMTAFLYYLLRYYLYPGRAGWRLPLLLGALAGLAASTKYSGLIAPAVAGQIIAVRLVRGPRRSVALRDGLVILALCLAIGSWKYIDNYRQHGTPLYANGTAAQGFSGAGRRSCWCYYDFIHFHLSRVLGLMGSHHPDGKLIEFPVYDEIWTSLHAQAWSDMSFFSVESRHGTSLKLYPSRGVPLALSAAVLYLALLPDLLAVLGFFLVLGRRSYLPLALFTATSLIVYVYWVTGQEEWAIKFKYILFLLPAAVVFANTGLRWLWREMPNPLRPAVALLITSLIFATNLYLFKFAVG